MPNPLLNIVHKLMPAAPLGTKVWAELRREIVGVAQDYWKDGHWEKPEPKKPKPVPVIDLPAASRFVMPAATDDGLWRAQPGEISEKMWGQGFVTPGDATLSELLLTPLGVSKDMSLLDLSAGLGGRLRKAVNDFGVYINGREPDPTIAARGMELSVAAGMAKKAQISAYDPMTLTEPRKYECVVARETIYRVPDKEQFIKSIVACCKPKAQISFTDYIVNPEARDQPAITMWRAYEKGSDPIGLVEMAELWAKAGISIRVHDDQTDFYKKEVKAGMIRFAKFMASGVKPDPETKKAIEKRITTWALRMAALEQGMKLYRFYGLR